MKKINIAIDGPSSSGKSTIGLLLAKKTNKTFISTGLIYRAISWYILQEKIDCKDHNKILQLVNRLNISFNNKHQIVVNNQILTNELRTLEVDEVVYQIAAIPKLRQKLIPLQRNLATNGGVVMEGRDIGTIIIPNAPIKIYLTCNLEIRAKRRFNQQIKEKFNTSFFKIKSQIQKRDNFDKNRFVAPLKKANDTFEIDSSFLTPIQVVKKIIVVMKKKKLDE